MGQQPDMQETQLQGRRRAERGNLSKWLGIGNAILPEDGSGLSNIVTIQQWVYDLLAGFSEEFIDGLFNHNTTVHQ